MNIWALNNLRIIVNYKIKDLTVGENISQPMGNMACKKPLQEMCHVLTFGPLAEHCSFTMKPPEE